MDDSERSSPIQSVQPVRKIRAQLFKRERRELMYLYEKDQRWANKRKKSGIQQTENLASEASTPEEIKQDLLDYKLDLKTRLTFDRAQILHEEPSSD